MPLDTASPEQSRPLSAIAPLAEAERLIKSPRFDMAAVVAALVILGFFGLLVWVLRDPGSSWSPSVTNLLHVTIGALVSAFTGVVHYHVGSRDKDRAVATMHAMQSATTSDILNRMQQASEQHHDLVRQLVGSHAPATMAAATGSDEFDPCIAVVLQEEGGFVDNPKDPGGATNMGITLRTLSAWRHKPTTVQDVQNLSVTEAKQIYRMQYWHAMRCGELPAGVDLMVLDFGVNAGPVTSVRLLQCVVGVTDDGVIGPTTLRAVAAMEARLIVARLAEGRLEYYRRLSTFSTFGEGWTRRVETVRRRALMMLR